MAMTKKHYSILAGVLKHHNRGMSQLTVEAITKSLIVVFSANDSNFNKDKFMKECGL